MRQETLAIEGMSCQHCVRAVVQALDALPGIVSKHVEVGKVDLSFEESKLSREQICSAIEEEGYRVIG
jgi:copper chaperone